MVQQKAVSCIKSAPYNSNVAPSIATAKNSLPNNINNSSVNYRCQFDSRNSGVATSTGYLNVSEMFTKLLTLSALFVSAYCLSIGTVSEQNNVTKREANAGDLFPDWVPFKNKHGDQLGEFVQVQKTSKVKKRLAPPINFLLRAVAEPEGDDYYDKSGGESDSEDNFESKDWSDLHRPAEAVDKLPVNVNHTDISDIDGVVNIIVNSPPNPIIEAILNENPKANVSSEIKDKNIQDPVIEEKVPTTTEKVKQLLNENVRPESNESEEKKENKKDINNEEDTEDYSSEERPSEKSKEDKENEEKKAKILSGVDELKERHAEEQRELTEKLKGENLFKNEFGKDESSEEVPDRFSGKYSEESSSTEQSERTRKSRRRKPTPKPDYDEYEDENKPGEDKYKINVEKPKPEPDYKSSDENQRRSARVNTRKQTVATPKPGKKEVQSETGKISVFKNPHLFMTYEDSDEYEESRAKKARNTTKRGPKKFSSKYTTTSPSSSNERISLVPVDSKEGEPTLFFPQARKNKKKKKVKTTTEAYDSTVAETVTDNYKQTTAYDVTGTDAGNATEITTYGTGPEEPDTTGSDSVPVRTKPAADAVPAPSDHKKEHQKQEDYHKEKGGGREHHEEHSEEHEEHGKKAYEGHHEDTKTAKGHHDKENHLGKYDDHGGVEKHHSEESGHYGDHHHEEHGKKHAKYEESGKHSKGHSTKGSHDIHKKEEYEKKVEFFEEEGDSAEDEKHGGFSDEKEHSEGGKFGKSHLDAGHHQHHKGESGHYNKGGHEHGAKGHKVSGGHDGHGKSGHKHFHKEGKDGGRKWVFHHGHPAKTANLVVIDRRGFDQFYHGPHYYG